MGLELQLIRRRDGIGVRVIESVGGGSSLTITDR